MKTPSPFVEDLSVYADPDDWASAAKEDHIYMDAMGFGMGNEAHVLYDHLTPLCPIMVKEF